MVTALTKETYFNNKENEKIISDLNAALEFEKEKSLNIELALQSVTEHEKELKEKIRTMEETSKNKLEEEEYALEEKEKEIAELTANLEYEKDKRKHIERMFQDLTERENDLQKKVKASEEKSKVQLYILPAYLLSNQRIAFTLLIYKLLS